MAGVGLVIDLGNEGLAAVTVRYDAARPDQKLEILGRAMPGLLLLDEALTGIVEGPRVSP
jgi:hypothetical protein